MNRPGRVGLGARVLAPAVPLIMTASLRRGLAGVWCAAGPPLEALAPAGAVVVANHHSWWDGYLAWLLGRRAGRTVAMLIDEDTLRRFPFFRLLGGLEPSAVRAASRRARTGSWVVVFPEGTLGPTQRLGAFAGGAAAIARWAGVPTLPLGIRVVLRARQRPEAFLMPGDPLPPGAGAADQERAVARALGAIDAAMAAEPDPRAVPPGFRLLLGGVRDDHERAARALAPWRDG